MCGKLRGKSGKLPRFILYVNYNVKKLTLQRLFIPTLQNCIQYIRYIIVNKFCRSFMLSRHFRSFTGV